MRLREQRHAPGRLRRALSWLPDVVVVLLVAAAAANLAFDLDERWFGMDHADARRQPAEVRPPEGLDLDALLDQIEQEMKQAPAQKQWAMNHCLAEIGIRDPTRRGRAIGIGERLAVLIDFPASPGCTPPYAPVWIAEMVRRREGVA